MFIQHKAICKFLENAVNHYEKTAPTVSDYCDNLYIRVNGSPRNVSLAELVAVQNLQEAGEWIDPHYAANAVYHLMHRLGMPLTGQLGY